LAGAVSAQTTNFWENNPNSHAQPSNTPIVASVQIDGTAVTATDAMRLGAFVGNDLRGIAAKHTDGKFWIQVFYDSEAQTAENISFKFYNGTTEYTTCATILAGSDEGYGTPNEPQVLNFTTAPATITQTTQLASGWNWWSTPVELDNNGLQMLKEALGGNAAMIKSRLQTLTAYTNPSTGVTNWYGPLSVISNDQMYMIKANTSCEVEMEGYRASMTDHPITLQNGWNWIGYPVDINQSIGAALGDFVPNAQDMIKGRTGTATYYNGTWYGQLQQLDAGQGYMYKSNSSEPRTFVFQKSRGAEVFVSLLNEDKFFAQQVNDYAHNMVITAVVDLDGMELRSEQYELAAFVGNECRGSVKLMYIEPIDRYVAFLLTFGDAEQPVNFVLTDGNETSLSDDHVMYSNDAVVGSLLEPVVLHFGPLGLSDAMQSMVSVYPNPSSDVFNVEGAGIEKYEVINSFGQIVYSKVVNNDFVQIDLSNHATGTYLLRIITKDRVITNQLIKK